MVSIKFNLLPIRAYACSKCTTEPCNWRPEAKIIFVCFELISDLSDCCSCSLTANNLTAMFKKKEIKYLKIVGYAQNHSTPII